MVAVGMKLGGMVMGGVMGWAGLGLGRRMVVMQGPGMAFVCLGEPRVGGCFVRGKRGGDGRGELWFRRGKMLS